MKKPYSKYMDDKTIRILEKSIKASEVQRTIEMVDTLILFYCEDGLDIDEEDDDDPDSDIPYGNEPINTNRDNLTDMNNKEITDYRLLVDTFERINDEVLRFMNSKKGWQPYGNPFYVGRNQHGFDFIAQAMVKYK